eukprot:m.322056 g.322056  ORF g.322056 m.322056 type:complete len:70 (-) comp26313_c0_seq1:36-245(-)
MDSASSAHAAAGGVLGDWSASIGFPKMLAFVALMVVLHVGAFAFWAWRAATDDGKPRIEYAFQKQDKHE